GRVGLGTARRVENGHTMVLVVVREEGDEVVAECHARFEHGGVPGDHRLVARRLEDDVGELLRCDPPRGRRERPGYGGPCAHRLHPWSCRGPTRWGRAPAPYSVPT